MFSKWVRNTVNNDRKLMIAALLLLILGVISFGLAAGGLYGLAGGDSNWWFYLLVASIGLTIGGGNLYVIYSLSKALDERERGE